MVKILKKSIKEAINKFYQKASKESYAISSSTVYYGEVESEEGKVSDAIYVEILTEWGADSTFIDLEILHQGLNEMQINEKINEWTIWLMNGIASNKVGKVQKELIEPKIRVLKVSDSKGNVKVLDRRYIKAGVINLFTRYQTVILECGEFTEVEYRAKILREGE